MPEVTVIIPNYNGIGYLKVCLESLREQSLKELEVLVVDNGSSDGSTLLLRDNYPWVRVVSLPQNYGFCRAVNVGIKAAKTPFVLLLNNDTQVEQNFAEELLKAIKRSKQIFSCQAKMLSYHEKNVIDDAGDLYCALGWAFARGKGKPDTCYQKDSEIFACCAGAAIYRRDILKQIGYFDERHFAYLEDIDLGYRARIHGYVNEYAYAARVYHVGSGTTGSRYNEFKVRSTARNSIYLVYKNMPFGQLLINFPFLFLGILIKQLFFLKKGLGRSYLTGLFQGIQMCKRKYRVRFRWKNFRNYCNIQIDLWKNIWKRAS